MANPSPQAISLIRQKVSDWSPPDAEIAAALNAPSLPNPDPPATVPKPYGFADVMGKLAPGSVANIRDLGSATDLIGKINAMDRPGLAHWVGALLAPPALITTEEATAVLAVLQATEPDPGYPSQLSWAVANLGRPVDLDDVAASRPGA